MRQWQPIKTVPRGKLIKVKTVRGIVCAGIVSKRNKFIAKDGWGERRITATRTDLPTCKTGTVRAVAWR